MARFDWKSRSELDAEAQAQALASLRARRDKALRESDWTQLPDAPVTASERAEWTSYRQALRDLPETVPDPTAARLPNPPE